MTDLTRQQAEIMPVRRFLARMLDVWVYSGIWNIFLITVCDMNPDFRSGVGHFLDIVVTLLLILLIEPILLWRFGSTLGKWVLGMRVYREAGNGRLTYLEAFCRTWMVVLRGLGFAIPVYNLYRLWKSWRSCKAGELLPWEGDSRVLLRDRRKWRFAACILCFALVLGCQAGVLIDAGLPDHRGDVTAEQFCENYNQLSSYHLGGCRFFLQPDGTWVRNNEYEDSPLLSLVSLGERKQPKYLFKEEDGTVKGVSFVCGGTFGEEIVLPSYLSQRMISVMTLSYTQKNYFSYSKDLQMVLEQIADHPYQSFTAKVGAVEVTCRIDHDGYETVDDGATLFLKDGRKQGFLTLDFSVEKR